ncbi:MAG: T9SS type A sorting domain-containing protein [Bacteroidales bacterium]|nr:T9SS type A sorting domain-containing protein [Bacteroidales bacterium]MCF8389934.1 T9SS type A sorting domain-containing protein [Bacteroidales bacterium]
MRKTLLILFFSFQFCAMFSQKNDLDYFRSVFSEELVKDYIERAYTHKANYPLPTVDFDAIRPKSIGSSFYEPNFGRKWTYIFSGGKNIMNSERNAWNSDTSLFFLQEASGSNYVKLALFDGSTAEYIRSITITGVPSSSTAIRWLPGDPENVFYFAGNLIKTCNINTGITEVFQEFASFSLNEKDVGGGDGNDVSPDGDLLISNKGKNAFVYNFYEKKVVRHVDGSRVYLNADSPFPTFDLATLDYVCAFADHIFEVDEDGGGVVIRNFNGTKIQSIYKRTPHMDPTYFKDGDKLYPGLLVRYNAADASYYSAQGYPSKTGKAFFHAFNPENPSEFLRFPMDEWNSATLGSGCQFSANRYDGTTGMSSNNGPILYDLPWEPRFGECFENSYNSEDSEIPRRFAHHYIGYETTYTSSQQPEGWNSPDGNFAIIKTYWGWYKVDLAKRLSKSEVDDFLNAPAAVTYSLIVNSGSGDGQCVEGTEKIIIADSPASGFIFDKWTGDTQYISDPTKAETFVTMPASGVTITANYKEADKFSLNIIVQGHGSVSTNPTGTEFYTGVQLALIATPDEGYSFLRWTDDLVSTQNPALLLMDGNKEVTAVFSDFPTSARNEFIEPSEKLSVYPNPFKNDFTIQFNLAGNSEVVFKIFDVTGNEISYSLIQEFQKGKHNLTIESTELNITSGIYFLQMTANNEVLTRKIVFTD